MSVRFAQKTIGLGALGMMVSVILGAVGAHVLAGILTGKWLQVYQIAVEYQIYHSLGLILSGLLILYYPSCKALVAVALLMMLGIILFSGSLYLLVIFHYSWLGIFTPFGGVCWIVAWGMLAWILIRYRLHHK
ncbi:DUF423 domain-containing protein [Piscirickettsia litoralis]|uniref:DUF423 domain-containing protein n=1 Tax=Piscirickettsia litoralis TaxID=1891921 RepID=A0ABX3A2P7_9GAMM|nr:DUF423 domain-containing protein [Piscirickettsia litoralis]ODN42909.1 hypothetical protein BGC07_08195 [Piscirickettsia litoralis]